MGEGKMVDRRILQKKQMTQKKKQRYCFRYLSTTSSELMYVYCKFVFWNSGLMILAYFLLIRCSASLHTIHTLAETVIMSRVTVSKENIDTMYLKVVSKNSIDTTDTRYLDQIKIEIFTISFKKSKNPKFICHTYLHQN